MRTKKKVLYRLDVEAGRKRLLSAVLWMTVFCCLLVVRVEASPTDLADQGIPLMPVVVAPTANASVRLSATNLAMKLSQIVGGTFTVATGDGSTGIAVGLGTDFTAPTWPFGGAYFDAVDPTRYEEYGLQSHADGVFVGGASSMAVEYAVWDLLFRMGWRQFFPSASWEVTPSSPDLAIEVQAPRESPDYYDRNFWYGWGTWPDNAALTTQWKLRNRVGRGLVINLGHAYQSIISRNQAAFTAHPEYLALVDGVRTGSKFCISNPDLRQLVVDDTLAQLAANPSLQSISLEPSDGGGWCECANCASLGSISDRVVTLNNQVADALDPAYPNTYLGMYAYNQHSVPPAITVHPRVAVGVATAFRAPGYTVEQLMAGWHAKGAMTGIREYYSVNVWDRDLPGKATAANLDYIATSLPAFKVRGASFISMESGDGWGPCGLGYYLMSRGLWSTEELADADGLVEDFLTRCFGSGTVRSDMRDFYDLITLQAGEAAPYVTTDLLGRMYISLNNARQGTNAPAILQRIFALALYTRYVELYRAYSGATGTARQTAFEAVMRFAYRIHPTTLVNSYALWRDLPSRDATVTVPAGAVWNIPEPDNLWKSSQPYTDVETIFFITNGIANNPLLPFAAQSFSTDLVPAGFTTPEEGVFAAGTYSYVRADHTIYLWAETAGDFTVVVNGGQVTTNPPTLTTLKLYAVDDPAMALLCSTNAVNDRQDHAVGLTTPFTGLHRLEVGSANAGTHLSWPSDMNAVFQTSLDQPQWLSHRVYSYFYVPKGTTHVGFYADNVGYVHGALDTNRLLNITSSTPAYYSIPVPPDQDGKLWQFKNSAGRRLLMTVPPYQAIHPSQMMLPKEVMERDFPDSSGHAAGGTPHWWLELFHLTSNGATFDEAEADDIDNDTFTSGAEYIADTDPTNGASFFHIVAVSNLPPLKFYFEGSLNRIYTLRKSTNLMEGRWADVPGQGPRMGSGPADSMLDTDVTPRQFYRVVVELP